MAIGVGLTLVTSLVIVIQGVFGKTWDVKLPQSIMGISGSCITVPCHFEIPDDQEENLLNCSNSGMWRRGSLSGPIVINSQSPTSNKITGSVIGDLLKKNCTTVLHSFPKEFSDTYFFRLQCPDPLVYTFNEGVNISTQTAPPPPVVTSVSQVLEGAQVRLQCSAPAPCHSLPPSLTWLPQDDSRQEETQVLQSADGEMTMTSTLTFTASSDHHNQSLVCSVSYPLSAGGSTETSAASQRLNVLYAPRFTTAKLSTSGPVSEGSTVTFTCSSDANPSVSRYSWFRDDSGALTKLGQEETLVLQVNQEDSGTYMCEAQTLRGSQRSRPVTLEVSTTKGRIEGSVLIPYVLCGVVFVLFVLTVAVDLYKYKSLSRRLKELELKAEHTYTDLRTVSIKSDYEQIQFQQQKTKKASKDSDYENRVSLQTGFRNQPQPNRTRMNE